MKRTQGVKSYSFLILALVSALGLAWARPALAAGRAKVSVVVYVIERTPLRKGRSTSIEAIAAGELAKRTYRVLPTKAVADLARFCPRDVSGVWNVNSRLSFRRHLKADVLWMAIVDYRPDGDARSGGVSGTIWVTARAFSPESGESLWYGPPTKAKVRGRTLEEALHRAVRPILEGMIASFDRSPKIKALATSRRPHLLPRTFGEALRPGETRSPQPEAAQPSRPSGRSAAETYTGIVIHAEHLPVQPSFRTRFYSQRGRLIYPPEVSRMAWTDSTTAAQRLAGPRPLHIKALAGKGNRIYLPESAARRLKQEKQLLRRGRVTIVVRPPARR